MPIIQTSPPPTSFPMQSSPVISSPTSMASSSSTPMRAPAPYMVALSGWPEPVYISNSRSRPTTPRPIFPGEVSDGIAMPPPPLPSKVINSNRSFKEAPIVGRSENGNGNGNTNSAPPPAQSIFSKTCMYQATPESACTVPHEHPDHLPRYAMAAHHTASTSGINGFSRREEKSSTFPTSSTRTPTHSPPPESSPTAPGQSSSSRSYQPQTQGGVGRSRHATFNDPRLAPHVAVLHNRPALPVAPNWTTSSPPSSSTPLPPMIPVPNVGMKVPAGQRGMGILVLRAVPDVYPPPTAHSGMAGMASSMSRSKANGVQGMNGGGHVGVATEVYPRDPDSAFLWGSAASPQVGSQPDEDVDMESQRERDGW